MVKTWRSKLPALGVCLFSLLVLALILSSRSKTLDLVILVVLFGGRVVYGTFFLTRLRVHYDRTGQMSFRYRRPDSGILAKWQRWILGECSSRNTTEK